MQHWRHLKRAPRKEGPTNFRVPQLKQSAPAAQAHSSVGMTPMGANKAADCYRPSDLRLGATIGVHGRRFFLHDCDAFTRQYYQVNS